MMMYETHITTTFYSSWELGHKFFKSFLNDLVNVSSSTHKKLDLSFFIFPYCSSLFFIIIELCPSVILKLSLSYQCGVHKNFKYMSI